MEDILNDSKEDILKSKGIFQLFNVLFLILKIDCGHGNTKLTDFFTNSYRVVVHKNKDITSENTRMQLELACAKAPIYNDKHVSRFFGFTFFGFKFFR